MGIGEPGSVAASSAVSGCAVGIPARTNAPRRAICADHVSQRGCQAWAATAIGAACSM